MTLLILLAALLCSAIPAVAQSPAENGNRANGFSYQPTPSQVAPREKAAGVQPQAAQQKRANRDLEQTDKQLLQEEGLSTKSVPKLTKPSAR
ncbi:hypothetical protein [Rhodopila sp.]|uniref:hypothetical protein n=1 Tax=Rhodopila sp. TaxID=2480087 RepID=UPI003D11BC13